MRMYSYYLERGIAHTVLDGLNRHERNFYMASMLANTEERTEARQRRHKEMQINKR